MTEHPDWVRRLNLFGDAVGDPALLVGLDADELLATARASTGLDDLGEADWPGWETTFRTFLAAADSEAQLHLVGRVVTRSEVLRMLQTWLRLQEHWRMRPAVTAEPVDAPLFVVGPPRTGTTILLELLALDPALRAPLAWEAVQPLPRLADRAADRAERIRLAESEQELWADVHPEFLAMHELASTLPCECVHFLAYDFAGPYWSMLYDTPSFTGWQLEHLDTLARVYRLHRRMLQTFQHGDVPRRWLLKSPAHVSTLPQLFTEYPDALVIHTHRDPRRFIASLVSLLGVVRFMRSDAVDPRALGPVMEMTYQFFLDGAIAQREDGSVPADRVVDSHFLDLMADPVAELRGLYEQLGLDWPTDHDTRIRDYLAAKPRGKHGEHRYSFADVGLDEDHVRATFAHYVAHYAIAEE
ncbi:MAG: sulfotransferase family protein [Acidimicrobiia bacterium]